jgi:hypothetical protein
MRLLHAALGLLASAATAAAARLYDAPADLRALVQSADCDNSDLPDDFHVLSFAGRSANGTAAGLESFEFAYIEDTNGNDVRTTCRFNSTSKNLATPGGAPEFACDNLRVQFMWQPANSILSISEAICPGPDGYVPVFICSFSSHTILSWPEGNEPVPTNIP